MERAGPGVNRNLTAGSALAPGRRSPGAELEPRRRSHPPRPPRRHHAPVRGEWRLGGSGPRAGPGRWCTAPQLRLEPAAAPWGSSRVPLRPRVLRPGLDAAVQVVDTLRRLRAAHRELASSLRLPSG
ncbi:hypothetical protein NN561_017566 [Cricetulus griseus]